MVRSRTTTLTGWGRTSPTVATVVDATTRELTNGGLRDLAGDLVGGRGVIARGMGRAYGDPAQNGGGSVIRLAPGPIVLDEGRGTVHVGAGVSLDELMRHLVPRGWFVPVTPGTRFVTIGGAIASDIHGKNHHADGSIGSHLEQLTILLADGTPRCITAATDADLWWATIGGMGLTGIILDATMRLIPVETSRCLVDTERIPNLDALLATMEEGDHRYRYSVAWIDLVATGRHLGRSVLTSGDHATLEQLAAADRKAAEHPLAFAPPALPSVPSLMPNVLTRPAVRAFNELWYRKAPRSHQGIETITGFFHPLDMVGEWTRLYGPAGFLQYQFVVPFDEVEALRAAVERVAASGHASFLAILKRFGAESGGLLSFPKPGWTLTLDLPAGATGLDVLLADLDRMIIDAGGRHYLAKDATTTAEVIRAGYPRLDDFIAVRRSVDPDRLWASDQARRLELL